MSEAKLALYGLAVAIVIVVIGFTLWNWDPFNRRKNAEQTTANVEKQLQVTNNTQTVTDHYIHDVTVLHDKAETQVEKVKTSPGAATTLDPVRRANLCSALSSLRDGAAACADIVGAAQPAQPMP